MGLNPYPIGILDSLCCPLKAACSLGKKPSDGETRWFYMVQ